MENDTDVRKIITWDGHRYLPIPYEWIALEAKSGRFEEFEVLFGADGELILRPHRQRSAHGGEPLLLAP